MIKNRYAGNYSKNPYITVILFAKPLCKVCVNMCKVAKQSGYCEAGIAAGTIGTVVSSQHFTIVRFVGNIKLSYCMIDLSVAIFLEGFYKANILDNCVYNNVNLKIGIQLDK